MKERILAALFAVCSAAFTIQSASSYWHAHVLRAQESRMHVVANRDPRKSDARWKHDERALLRTAADDENAAFWKLAVAIFSAGACCLAWKNRPYKRYRELAVIPRATLEPAPTTRSVSLERPLGRRELTVEEKKKASGERGEEEILEALRPLIDDGWTIIERNPVIVINGRAYGDIDIILRSPLGVGFTVDAKNGLLKAWVHDEHVNFEHLWYDDHPEPYPLKRAWLLADWVRDQPRYGFTVVRPVLAFTASIKAGNLRNRKGVLVVEKANLCDELRRLESRVRPSESEGMNRYALPEARVEDALNIVGEASPTDSTPDLLPQSNLSLNATDTETSIASNLR